MLEDEGVGAGQDSGTNRRVVEDMMQAPKAKADREEFEKLFGKREAC